MAVVAREIACRREPDPRVVPEYAAKLYAECLARPQMWDWSDWRWWAICGGVLAVVAFLGWVLWILTKEPKE